MIYHNTANPIFYKVKDVYYLKVLPDFIFSIISHVCTHFMCIMNCKLIMLSWNTFFFISPCRTVFAFLLQSRNVGL